MGVRKAMDKVLDVSHGSEITYTIGPLIHNPQAMEMLEARNIYIADTLDEKLSGKTVVIRAHGVPPEIYQKLDELGAEVVDATCPKVLRSQGIIKKYVSRGYSIVIIGDRGHAEIEALLGLAEGSGAVVENANEAQALPAMEKVCVVSQTTLDLQRFDEIVEEIKRHTDECYIANTICSSTERRQNDIRKLAEETDATVVVGGRNSANTNRLAKISKELGQPTFLIEDPAELNLEQLSKYYEIGVTAGASTPHWVIQEVVDRISAYTPSGGSRIVGFLKNVAFLAVEGNFVTCLAAAAMTYAMCILMNIPPEPRYFFLTFFYLFPMHTVNKYLEINWKSVALTDSASFIRKYWRVFLGFALVSAVISLAIAWESGLFLFLFVAISYLFAGLYSVRIIPSHWNWQFKSIRDIPGSKDVVIATAWAIAGVVLPSISHGSSPGVIGLAGAAYVFIIVFSKATLLAIGGMQSDKLVGLETIPVLIGKKATEKLLYILDILLALTFAVLAAGGAIAPGTLVLLLPIAYSLACIRRFSRKEVFFRTYHHVILDADYLFMGLLAYLFLR